MHANKDWKRSEQNIPKFLKIIILCAVTGNEETKKYMHLRRALVGVWVNFLLVLSWQIFLGGGRFYEAVVHSFGKKEHFSFMSCEYKLGVSVCVVLVLLYAQLEFKLSLFLLSHSLLFHADNRYCVLIPSYLHTERCVHISDLNFHYLLPY